MAVSLNRAFLTAVDKKILNPDSRLDMETPCQCTVRISIFAITALTAYGATLSDFASAIEWADDNPYYATVLIVGHSTTISALYFWTLSEIIQDRMRPLSEAEKLLVQGSRRRTLETGLKISSIAMGLLTRVPAAYSAYLANEDTLAYIMPGLVFLAFPVPAYSTLLAMHRFALNRTLDGIYLELHNLKGNLRRKIDNKYSELLYAQELPELPTSKEDFFDQSTNASQPLQLPVFCQFLAKFIGASLATALLTLIALLSYDFGKALDSDVLFSGAVAAIITSVFSYLLIVKTANATQHRFEDIHTIIKKRQLPQTPANLCFPKAMRVFKLALCTPSLVAYGPIFQACKEQTSSSFTPILQTTTYAAIFIITSDILPLLGERIATEAILQWGTENQKATIQTFENLKTFQNLISLTSYRNTARFLERIYEHNAELFSRWTENTSLSIEKVHAFATTHSRSAPQVAQRHTLL